ncbi:unnamed protein product, partial [Musa acuminata var. zebrina]
VTRFSYQIRFVSEKQPTASALPCELDKRRDRGESGKGEDPAEAMVFAAATTTTTAPSSAAASPLQSLARGTLRLSFGSPLLHPQSSSASPKKGRRLVCSWSSPKAVYSANSWAPERSQRKGIWSIRDDLVMPSSPYFPIEAQGGQGPPPMVQERFQSVISQLFQHRIIRFGGPVDDDMANIIVAQLLYLDAVDPTKDIVMYVNSPGGSVTAGMAVFDTMRHIRPDVSTVCVGLAASMGAFILSSGTKGKRYSLPNSRIMIHQPLGGAQGGQTDIDIQANEMLHHKANLNGYLAYHTGQSFERINQDTDRDYFMSAKEAKEYGLIDGVIMNPLKALQPLPATQDFLKHFFHTLSIITISLLFPASFLTLDRFTAASTPSIPPSSVLATVFLRAVLPVINGLVSVVCLAALVHSLTGRMVKLPAAVAWTLLCLFHVCLSLGTKVTIASRAETIDEALVHHSITWIKRAVLFVGLHRTMRVWARMVVKRVADDTIFGAEVQEGISDKVVVSVAFATLWITMLQNDIARMVFAAVEKGLTKDMDLDGYVGWFVSHAIVMTGMVRSVQGLLCVGNFLFCRCREADEDHLTADHKV